MTNMHGYRDGENEEPRGGAFASPWRGTRLVEVFREAAGLPEACAARRPAPVYDPAPWNDARVVLNANCYGYALQIKDWVHIGDLSLRQSPGTVSIYFNKVVADGLHPAPAVAPREMPPKIAGYYLVAMVSGAGWHWYRQDADGLWSHKEGEEPATNLDHSGQIIKDPRYADRGPYSRFEGFFYVPQDGLRRSF